MTADEDPLRGWVDDDLADRLAGDERVDIDLTASELLVAEWSRTRWVQRLLRSVGAPITVGLVTGHRMAVNLVEVLADGLLVDEVPHRVLVTTASVEWIEGLLDGAAQPPANPSIGQRTRSVNEVLRALANGGRSVALTTTRGVRVDGAIQRVGLDFLDLALERDVEADGQEISLPRHSLATIAFTA